MVLNIMSYRPLSSRLKGDVSLGATCHWCERHLWHWKKVQDKGPEAPCREKPGEVRARTCGTKLPSRSEALRFIDSAKSPSTKIDGSVVNFKRRLSNRHGRSRRMLIWTFERNTYWTACEHVNVIRTSRVLSPDSTWPDRWLCEMHESRRVGLRTTVKYV